MGTLQSSGAISLADVQAQLGGGGSISLSEYYRGGSYVPSTRLVWYWLTEPASGYYYSLSTSPRRNWQYNAPSNQSYLVWDNVLYVVGAGQIGSYSVGGWTYYRSTYITRYYDYGYTYFYGVTRQQYTNYSETINASVPSSGQISLSQLYGAANP